MPTSRDEDQRPAPILVLADLCAGYSKSPIVEDVSLTVGSGEVVTLLGPNGAGKSTVLKALIGSAIVLGGAVSVGGNDITSAPAHSLAGKGVGYVPQIRDVFEGLTVKENLEMGAYLLKKDEIPGRIDEVLETFPTLRTMLDRPARKLSGGERKMTAIARVLMARPKLMLLDEPTAGLAPALAERLLEEQIPAIGGSGTGVLLVEQKAASALAVADWAYLMVAGRISRAGHPTVLGSQSDFAEVFLGGQPASLHAS